MSKDLLVPQDQLERQATQVQQDLRVILGLQALKDLRVIQALRDLRVLIQRCLVQQDLLVQREIQDQQVLLVRLATQVLQEILDLLVQRVQLGLLAQQGQRDRQGLTLLQLKVTLLLIQQHLPASQ